MNRGLPGARAGLVVLGLMATVIAARPAAACETSVLPRGLTVVAAASSGRQIAADGVLAFDAFIRAEAPEVALARFSLTLAADGGGPEVSGTVSHVTLASRAYDTSDDYQEVVVIWRPSAPLAAGSYAAELTITDSLGTLDSRSFAVTVTDGAAPPLAPPTIARAESDAFDETLARVCCEVGEDSCGVNRVCEPARVRVVPGFTVEAALAPADVERAYLWVAPWDGEKPGAPFERMNDWYIQPDQPWWSGWAARNAILLPEAEGERCIVVGATSLIDGSTVLAAPSCGELTAAHEEDRTPTFPAPSDVFQRPCLSPPVYEDDGSPYPREAGGCRLAPGPGPGPLLLVVWALRRRRRAASLTASA